MKAAVVHVNFAKAVPRTIWYRSDTLPVIVAAVFSFVLVGISYISLQPTITNINQQDVALKEAHGRLIAGSTKIDAELSAVKDLQKNSGTVLQERQSGLTVAQQIVTLGNSLERDGVATRIDSKGEIASIANNFKSLGNIWNRLGANYAVTVADPTADGAVSFTIEPVTAVPSPVPVVPGNVTSGNLAPGAALPTPAAGLNPVGTQIAPTVQR